MALIIYKPIQYLKTQTVVPTNRVVVGRTKFINPNRILDISKKSILKNKLMLKTKH